MTKKDEIINQLILMTSKEIDYWLLESNVVNRENEYGPFVYGKIKTRFTNLRGKLLDVILSLPEVEKSKCSYENYEDNI
jgi:hypothetical protein